MKIAGIPVKVDLSFLLVGAILASSRLSQPELMVEWLLVVFISILIHEFGHALVCRSFGLSPQIQLYSMGGATSWSDNVRISPAKNIAISLAGPFAGFLFFALIYWARSIFPAALDSEFGQQLFHDLVWVNLFWGLVNLLPVLPLDGGHVVGSLEEMVTKKTGGSIAPALSIIVAAGVALWAFSAGMLFAAILMGVFAWINLSGLLQRRQARRDQNLNLPLQQAQQSFLMGDGNQTVRQAKEILKNADSQAVECAAQQLLVQGLILENNLEEAKKELVRLQAVCGHDAAEQALLALEQDQWPRALPLLEHAYRSSPTEDLGVRSVHALIEAHRFREAQALISDPRLAQYATGLYALLQTAALAAGDYETSAEAGAQAVERGGAPYLAYHVACAHARAGRLDQARQWLKRALDAGYNDIKTIEEDPDLSLLLPQLDLK